MIDFRERLDAGPVSKPSWSGGRVGVRMRGRWAGRAERSWERRFAGEQRRCRERALGSSEGRIRATVSAGPVGGWPVGVRRLVSAVLIFHIGAILVGALSASAVVAAGTFAGRHVRALSSGDRPGLRVPLLRPRAAADARGDGDGPLRRRPPGRGGPAPREGLFPGCCGSGNWRWPITSTRTPRRPRSRGVTASRSRWGRSYARHLGADAPRLFVGCAHQPAPSDSRGRAGSRGAGKAGLEAGGSRRRGVLHHARADRGVRRETPSERFGGLPGVPLADLGPGLERVLLHPGRPDRAGADPRVGRVFCCSGTWRSTASTSTAFSARRAGPTRRSFASSSASRRRMPGRSGSSFPTACSARPGSSAWWSWRFTPWACSAVRRRCSPGRSWSRPCGARR